ncbi:hypothetical protein DRO24_02950 [Candidatus Bathyarchaeota archaeon]|nr:MAG: hypothetical protein DRO24_02950 [Candidatus Bathyarchaeota archaeon]
MDYLPLSSTIFCYDCSDCSQKIQSASPGDTVYLNNSLQINGSTCIDFNGSDQITLDCQGHFISGNDTDNTYGISLPESSHSNTIQNCFIQDFRYGIFVNHSNYNSILNTTLFSNTDNIRLYYTNYTTIRDSNISYAEG